MGELCPRCRVNEFTPYDAGMKSSESAPYPALSRMDNRTYVCSWCGTDEAMRDSEGLPPIPRHEWPVDGDPRLKYHSAPADE